MLNVEFDGAVSTLTLSRPEVRNAFNAELIAALLEAFASLPTEARVVVLRGEGKAFCAGGDLEWMKKAASHTFDQNKADALQLASLFEAIASCPVPVIAQAHGAVFGGGCGLVAASDICIAAEGTLFAFSEAKLGLIPATISPFVLSKIGASHARALFTTAETFDARRAEIIGLVHQVVAPESLAETVEEKVKLILKNGPQAVRLCKRLASEPPKPADEAATLLAEARASAEGQEGISAFLERRPASFIQERP